MLRNTQPRDVFPDVLYFGQKDLGNRHENFEAEFFAMLTGSKISDERYKEEQLVLKVEQAVNSYQAVLKTKGLDDENAQEAERLKHQLDVYAEKKVDKQLESLTLFDTDRSLVGDLSKQLDSIRERAEQLEPDWQAIQDEWPELKSQTLKQPASRLIDLKKTILNLKSDYSRITEGLKEAGTELASIFSNIQELERQEQEGFNKLLRELDAPGLDLDAYRKMKLRHGQLVKLLQPASNRAQLEQTALSNVLAAAQNLHRHRREIHRKEEAELARCAESIPKEIQLTSQFEGDRKAFDDFIASQLSGRHFRRKSRDNLVDTLTNGLAIFERRDDLTDILGENADVEKLRTALFDNLAEFLTYSVPERREISFNGIPIENLSLGQRATAILTLLTSLDRYPVMLLDQPEDDLDNETIFRHVVEPLLDRKQQCQFVIATHNANIPVLGDAEQIHSCREIEHGKYDHESGSLDCPATSRTIVDIMEGGAAAFLRRQKVLQQWTKSVT